MINKNFRHTDPVRQYNENIFMQTKNKLTDMLSVELCSIINTNAPLDDRIDACYSFMQNVSRDAAGEMNVAYSLDIHTKLISSNTIETEFCHNINITPTEDMLEGRTDRLPVMKRGPDIPYIRV